MPQRFRDITLGDVGRGLARYRPFILTVAAIALIAILLPGHNSNTNRTNSSGYAGAGPAGAGSGEAGAPGAGAASGGGLASATSGGAGAPGSVQGAGAGAVNAVAPAVAAAGAKAGLDPNCDPVTGRIRIPSVYSPPCVPAFSGPNGGATYQGVTADTITVAAYIPQTDAATKAILVAGGDNDSDQQVAQDYADYTALFQRHMQTYGRKVKVVPVFASGPTNDDSAAKADAVKIAKQIHAMFVWNNPASNAFVEELVADHVVCICTTTLPSSYYLNRAPYVWGQGLPDETQAYTMRAEMIGKQIAGRKAQWAGDAPLRLKDRSFGLIWYNTGDNQYAPGERFFEQQLATYNVHLVDQVSYVFDPGSAQQTAQTIMSKFSSEGITSVIFVGDPIYPVFYTSAATKQSYHPEWIITGSALTDTTFFGRTYDKTQWNHAFGLSLLGARIPRQLADPTRIYNWQYHHAQPGPATAGVIYPWTWMTFTGIQLAGPNLNPQTFKQGLFSYPVSPAHGGIASPTASWGRHLWPYDDYNLYDDSTEIWWDNLAQGPDELDNNGVGMYRYIDLGKRYLPGQLPAATFKGFDPANTATLYKQLPPPDQFPDYPEKDYYPG
jgi:hypothetical protein